MLAHTLDIGELRPCHGYYVDGSVYIPSEQYGHVDVYCSPLASVRSDAEVFCESVERTGIIG